MWFTAGGNKSYLGQNTLNLKPLPKVNANYVAKGFKRPIRDPTEYNGIARQVLLNKNIFLTINAQELSVCRFV